MTVEIDEHAFIDAIMNPEPSALAVANSRAVEQTLTAVITRADGTVEHVGVVAYWHRNPIMRWKHRIQQFFKG